MANVNMPDAIMTPSETVTEHAAEAETAEAGDILSRLSLILGLSAIFLALADIAAIIVIRTGIVSPPSWVSQAQRLVPEVGISLAAAGVGLSLIGTWQLLARYHLFDPKETQQDLAIDDLSALLSRIHPGCAMRMATTFGLVGVSLAVLLSIWAVPFGDQFRVIGNNSVHTCGVTGTVAAFPIELDNSASTIAVSWSATPVEMVAGGVAWAQIIPAHGRLAAGQEQRISVLANALVCHAATPTAGAEHHSTGALALGAIAPSQTSYHVRVITSGTSTSDTTLAMSVLGPLASTGSPVPTATAGPAASPTAHPTPHPTPVSPTPISCPALGASITTPSNGAIYYTSTTITLSFVGRMSGACGAVPTSDITWSVSNAHYFPTPTIMGSGKSISYTLPWSPDIYTITFHVHDPTSGQTATTSITINVMLKLT